MCELGWFSLSRSHISESREQRTSDASQSSVSDQSSSNVGPTYSLRRSQRSRRPVIRLGQGAT